MKKVIKRKLASKRNPSDQSLDKSEFIKHVIETLDHIANYIERTPRLNIDKLVVVSRKLEEIRVELGLIGPKTPVRKQGRWEKDPERWI